MIIFADTRFGNPIWIDWEFDQFGKLCPFFPKFMPEEENYDAFVVFEFMVIRSVSKKEGFAHSFSYTEAMRSYHSRLILGHPPLGKSNHLDKTSYKARMLYARTLLRKEFLD